MPLFSIHIAGLTHPKKRCARCAGEPIPDVLPEEPMAKTVLAGPSSNAPAVSMDSFRSAILKDMPFDYKSAQAGRDVGEEG